MKPPLETHSSFEAHGTALAWWQHVEVGLYYILHGALRTKESLSSTVFFHIKSPTAKCGLVDALMKQTLDQERYDTDWTPLRKELFEAAEIRNDLAHFEMQGSVYLSNVPGEVLVRPELAQPYHDVKTHRRADAKRYSQKTLEAVARSYRDLGARATKFAEVHFAVRMLLQELVQQGRERTPRSNRKMQKPPKH